MVRASLRSLACLAAFASCTAGLLALQKATRIPGGDAAISGRVIDRERKTPVAGALVKLWIPPSTDTVLLTQTARDGRYSFEGIAPGNYRVTVLHDHYASQTTGRTTSGRDSVTLRVGRREHLERIDFALGRGAAIRGRLLDFRGEPLSGGLVTAGAIVGSLREPDSFVFPGMVRSDNRGEYIIPGLPEGNYRVSALCRVDLDGPPQSAVYHPGTSQQEDAWVVRARAGESVSGIDIACPPSDLLRLSGKVIGRRAGVPTDVYLLANNSSVQTITLDSNGGFSVQLRSGRYVLCASTRDGDVVDAAFATIDLDSDVTDLGLPLMATATISGQFVTADDSPRPNALFQVAAVLAVAGKAVDPVRRDRTDVSAEGTFEIPGLFGERILQVIGVPDGWEVQRILRGASTIDSLSVAPGEVITDIVVVIARQ